MLVLMLVVASLAYASAKNDEPDIKKEMEATQQNQTNVTHITEIP